MANHFGDELRTLLVSCELATESELRGCSDDEIEAIRLHQHVKFLPDIYRQLLRAVGQNAGQLFQGSYFECSAAPYLKEGAQEILEDEELPFVFPDDAFVFLDHQGYAWLYFHTATGDDDPPVYRFNGAEAKQVVIADSLSSFLWESIRELAPEAYAEYLEQQE